MQAYHRLMKTIGLGNPFYEHLSIRSHLLVIYDHFAVRYDWHHTYEEVFEWFNELGFFYKVIPGLGATSAYKDEGVSVIGIKHNID